MVLTDITGNNTSAADSFVAQANGNLGAGNVSKMPLSGLLYQGATTIISCHLLNWFDPATSTHMQVGYASNDAAQIAKQALDMQSRGISRVYIDWYGDQAKTDFITINAATLKWKTQCESMVGFTFAIVIDKGAIADYLVRVGGSTAQDALTHFLQYIDANFMGSSAYAKSAGKGIISQFDVQSTYGGTLNWTTASAGMVHTPCFIFADTGGFTGPAETSGSYSFVKPTIIGDPYGLNYLGNFYAAGKLAPSKIAIGAVYKGFNDSMASFGTGRIMSQQVGQTWLQTFAKANSLYSAATTLAELQLITWNDYEEGTELETGIETGVSVVSSLAGNVLSWVVTGSESLIDHYEVYATVDDNADPTLSPPTNVAVGAPVGTPYSLDLSTLGLATGTHSIYVRAVGKPCCKNSLASPQIYAATQASGSSGVSIGVSILATSFGNQASPLGFTREPIVNDDGTPTLNFIRWLRNAHVSVEPALTLDAKIKATTPIVGRSEGLGTTLQNVDAAGTVLAPGVDLSRDYVNKTIDNINDGTTYARIKGTELATGLINQVNSTSTDTASSSILSQSGTTSIIDVAAFTQQYARGAVAYNAGSVDAGSNIAKGYVFCNDPTYQGGSVVYQFTTVYKDIWSAAGNLLIGQITLSGGGGGTGGGGGGSNSNPCFAGNVRLRGGIPIGEMKDGQVVYTRHRVLGAKVRVRQYAGPMLDMGNGELVTPGHHFVCGDVELEARQIWTAKVEYAGPVYNLEVETDKDEDRNYFLDNGMLSHNMRYSGC